MRLLITHPELVPGLVSALNETECIATRVAKDTVDVFVPWLVQGGNRTQAATELLFFVRAWASDQPAFGATLVDAV